MQISEITHDKENSQLTMDVDGSTAYIDYKLRNDHFYLTYAKTPQALRGKGIGKILINKGLEDEFKRSIQKNRNGSRS